MSHAQEDYHGRSSATLHDMPGGYTEDEAPISLSQQSLTQAVFARRAEFTRPRSVRIKVGTWNVAAKSGTEKDVGGWFVGGKGVAEGLTGLETNGSSRTASSEESNAKEPDPIEGVAEQEARRTKKESTLPKNDPGLVPGQDEIGIYALGLQEVVDVSSATEALRPFADSSASKKYRKAIEEALPPNYILVAEQQLIGLLLLIYAAPEIASNIRAVSTTSVGTGLLGYMGNKGAVTARILLGETTRLAFINSHLSAGTGKTELERRNWDAGQIISRTKFDPVIDSLGVVQDQTEKIGNEDIGFWFGDLNYRLEGVPGEDVRRILMLHARNEYDIGSRSELKLEHEIDMDTSSIKSKDNHETSSTDPYATLMESIDAKSDPTSLQATIDSLLPHDELHQQQKARRMFQDGWKEGPITFLPTYKYDVGSLGVFDSSEKRRSPSWCDRILYRTRHDVEAYYQSLEDEKVAKLKDEEMRAQGVDQAAEDEDTLFEYDPDADGEETSDNEDGNATGNAPTKLLTKEGFVDTLSLDYYVSHQRVLSSDHKPLDAVFTLNYDAVIPDLKIKIQQEVAREIDRAENEGRPAITVVVDGSSHDSNPDFSGVNFGDVRYGEQKVRSVTIANTGRSPAFFGFVERPSTSNEPARITPIWLNAYVEQPNGDSGSKENRAQASNEPGAWAREVQESFTLQPGETCNVFLVVDVQDKSMVGYLNNGKPLEDVLVLRVKDGRDHFIPVHGSWLKTSHVHTIDKLIRIPEGGIRRLQRQELASESKSSEKDSSVMWSAPREIFRLTEAIEALVERTIAEWSMVVPQSEKAEQPPWQRFAGWPFVEESWRWKDIEARQALKTCVNEALDTDQPFDKILSSENTPLQKLEAMSEVLLIFLDNLEDGVITEELWTCIETEFFAKKDSKTVQSVEDQRTAILEVLHSSQAHSVTFILLTSMLMRIAQEIRGSYQELKESTNSIPELPASPKATVNPKSLDHNPVIARSQLVVQNLTAIFAEVLVRVPASLSNKAKAISQNHKKELVRIFIDGDVT